MAANICVDESFDTQDGVLTVKRCGATFEDQDSWPFDADPADANGLHKSDSCGMWVAPATTIEQIAVQQSLAPGNTITPPNSSTAPPLTLTFTNQSTYLSMMLALHMQVKWDIATTDEGFIVVGSGFTRDQVSVANPDVASWFRPSGSGTATLGWVGSHNEYSNFIVDPGQTIVIRLGFKVTAVNGTAVTFSNLTQSIRGFGITLNNPTPVY